LQAAEFVVMPNHVHGIVWITHPNGNVTEARTFGSRTSLSKVVGSFKGAVTRCVREWLDDIQHEVWQSSYFDHVIRDDRGLQLIREYILNNPRLWDTDDLNPHT
jgi:REP element-mobilizing transposase RayT